MATKAANVKSRGAVARKSANSNGNQGLAVPARKQQDDHLLLLSHEIKRLVDASREGRLSERGRVDQLTGDHRDIVLSVNDILDAMIGPLNLSAEAVGQLAKGIIPQKITATYNGDFNIIKNNLNACIAELSGLAEANKVLQQLAVNDCATKVEGSYQGIFAEVARATN